ncbi:hypothetical protein AK812_SmicGene2960 [Symbiodinium microadriaticum]|uniref:Uncharacterized protein n=1 Tax=Symbiodinium microadriaticum TaxID=2951 RepID=A0A1Q9F057_SYMMI|nr:hypothetical protein AK812_SmicGene2960 [Symbiodinium microadriaticum]
MSTSLSHWCSEVRPEILQLLTAEGVETPSDVVGIWPDLHSFVSELHNIPEASPDLVMEAAAFYSRARRLASRAVVDRAQDIIAVRDSNFLQRQTRVAPYAAAVSDKCSQAKLKIMWRQSAADVKPQAAADSTSLPVHVPELKDSKLQGLFSLLVKHVLDLSSLGIPPAEQHSQQSCQLIMKGASSASAAYIATATSSLRRWIRFASERQLSVVAPAPAELAAFFREVALGGPTAAASVYQSLSWLDKKFGIGWPLQHFLVCPYKLLSSGHASKQAKELEPWEFLNLVSLAEELTDSHMCSDRDLLQCMRGGSNMNAAWANLAKAVGSWTENVQGSKAPTNKITMAVHYAGVVDCADLEWFQQRDKVVCLLAEIAKLQPAQVYDGMFEGPRHSLLSMLAPLQPADFEECRPLVDLLTSLKYATTELCTPIETACLRTPTSDWLVVLAGMLPELKCLGAARVPLCHWWAINPPCSSTVLRDHILVRMGSGAGHCGSADL